MSSLFLNINESGAIANIARPRTGCRGRRDWGRRWRSGTRLTDEISRRKCVEELDWKRIDVEMRHELKHQLNNNDSTQDWIGIRTYDGTESKMRTDLNGGRSQQDSVSYL
jgi:hypothetical protein